LIRSTSTAAITASFSIDPRGEEITMTRTDPKIGANRPPRIGVIRFAAVVLIGGTLGACKTTETANTVPYPYNYKDRHPIAIHEGTRTVELLIGKRRAGLTPVQRAEVSAFAESWHGDATGGIRIRIPSGTLNERASHDTVPEIKEILAAAGVPPNGIVTHPLPGGDPAGILPIVLEYPRMVATAGPCGRWPNDLGPGAGIDYMTNAPYYNLGCSMQQNLAAMVEEPADLVQPRSESSAYTGRRTVVLDKYRRGEDTTTQAQGATEDKAKISDVGK
jgi:pilus assembly protein CpaD